VITLVVTLMALFGTPILMGFNAWMFTDVLIIFGLVFGISSVPTFFTEKSAV
jgi:hypothetical protein